MKKATKIILFTVSHFLVLIAGFICALWYLEQDLKKATAMMNSPSIISRYLVLAQAQRVLGKDSDYRDSLLTFLKALEEARSPIDPFFDEKSYNTEKTLTFVRLSIIEKKLGGFQRSEEYMHKALETCKKIGWKDCSESKLVRSTERLDNFVFGEHQETK